MKNAGGSVSQAATTADGYSDLLKQLDFPPADDIEELSVPLMKFITFSGKGSPQSGGFQTAIQALYGIVFTLKMGLKFHKIPHPDGYYDFKVSPLEGLWWQANGKKWETNHKEDWRWRLMIMVPGFVNQELVEQSRIQAIAKHPDVPYCKVILEEFAEGKAIQTTHVGPYSEEPATVDKLINFAKEHNYKINGKHHEIYMGDPRRTKPEKLKTVLRYPVN